MTSRDTEISHMLAAENMQHYTATPLTGDASSRRYIRLTSPGQDPVLLMDWPSANDSNTAQFVTIANLLRARGLSAPKIYAQNHENGLLLIEDLGDDLFADVLEANPSLEHDLYQAAVDFLIDMQRLPAAGLDRLEPRIMTDLTQLAFTEYRQALLSDPHDNRLNTALTGRFERKFCEILTQVLGDDMVFVHRDFHAQNLLWLPAREGLAKVGVIDFQDAKAGHPAYDLVSLLQDARRDVPPDIEAQMIDYYIAATGVDSERFRRAYAVIGVQRNMRILGIFARLAKKQGKPQYIDLIPRVWTHFNSGLDHPALAAVAEDLRAALPAPTPDRLARLRA